MSNYFGSCSPNRGDWCTYPLVGWTTHHFIYVGNGMVIGRSKSDGGLKKEEATDERYRNTVIFRRGSEETARKAEAILAQEGFNTSYGLVFNNCEQFCAKVFNDHRPGQVSVAAASAVTLGTALYQGSTTATVYQSQNNSTTVSINPFTALLTGVFSIVFSVKF
jgi:hypothetical protein